MTKKPVVLTLALALAIGMFLVPGLQAQTWYTANQRTVTWDATTTLNNGDPLPEGSTISYDVWIANAVTDPNKANPVKVATIQELSYTITLNTEGRFFVGISSNRIVDGEIISTSTISWSDNPEVCENGVAFGLRYYFPPSNPVGLRAE